MSLLCLPLYRALILALSILLVTFTYRHLSLSSISISPLASLAGPPASPSSSDPDFLSKESYNQLESLLSSLDLSPNITLASRILRSVPDAPTRNSLTDTQQALFSKSFEVLPLDALSASLPLFSSNPEQALEIHTPHHSISPRPSEIDASSLLFGVSTTYKRFVSSPGPLDEWPAWLTDGEGRSNGAGLVVTLHDATDKEIEDAGKKLKELGVHAKVLKPREGLEMAGRYLDLVRLLHEEYNADREGEERQGKSRKEKKYFVLADDDTFFPALNTLIARLEERFSPEKEYYIGALTERLDFLLDAKRNMAYGGAGIFLTPPLAENLLSSCFSSTSSEEEIEKEGESKDGDVRLYNCVKKYTELSLSTVEGLHQLDQWGDPSGFYESGRETLSLHHYRSWHFLRPEEVVRVGRVCGEGCVLQRFVFGEKGSDPNEPRELVISREDGGSGEGVKGEQKGKWILTNGYSLAYYPEGIDFDTEQMEGTFVDGYTSDDVSLSYTFGPLGKSLSKTGRKRAWGLVGSWVDDDDEQDVDSGEKGEVRKGWFSGWRDGGDDGNVEGRGNGKRVRNRAVQVYLKRMGDERWYTKGEEREEWDSLVLLVWED